MLMRASRALRALRALRAPPGKATRAEARALTRERLLEAAAQTFARKGYAGATVEEIAEARATRSARCTRTSAASRRAVPGADVRPGDPPPGRGRRDAPGRRRPGPGGGAGRVPGTDGQPGPGPHGAPRGVLAVRGAQPGRHGSAHRPAARAGRRDDRRGQRGDGTLGSAARRLGQGRATVVLAMFQGLARQRRIDPDRVSGELLAQGLRWLFAGLHAPASEPPPE